MAFKLEKNIARPYIVTGGRDLEVDVNDPFMQVSLTDTINDTPDVWFLPGENFIVPSSVTGVLWFLSDQPATVDVFVGKPILSEVMTYSVTPRFTETTVITPVVDLISPEVFLDGFIDVFDQMEVSGSNITAITGRFTEHAGFTQADTAKQATIDGSVADWGSAADNEVSYDAPAFASTIREVSFIVQHDDLEAYSPRTTYDFIGNTSTSLRLALTANLNRWFYRVSGSDTFGNGDRPTHRPFMARGFEMITVSKSSGISFDKLLNGGDGTNGWNGKFAAVIPTTAQQTSEKRKQLFNWLVSEGIAGVPDEYFEDNIHIVNATTGDTVYLKGDADYVFNPDSVTKVMMALTVYDALIAGTINWTTTVLMSSDYGTANNLVNGDTYTVEQLLYAAMLSSDNQAAYALGILVGGDLAGWVALSDAKQVAIGMTDTVILRPDGLSPSGQEMSVSDAVAMMRYLNAGSNYTTAPTGGVSLFDVMATGEFAVTGSYTAVSTYESIRYSEIRPGCQLIAKGGIISVADAVAIYVASDGVPYAIVAAHIGGTDIDASKARRWEALDWAVDYVEQGLLNLNGEYNVE